MLVALVVGLRRPPEVMLRRVERGTAVDAVYASGTIEAIERVEIKARVSGAVDEILVKEGERVTRGQVLARLDVPTARIELDRERAEVDAASRRAESSLAALAAQERILRAQLGDAQAELKKAEQLLSAGTITPREIERAQLAAAVLAEQLAAIQAQRRETEVVRQAEVRRSESALATSKTRVHDTDVRTPIAGDVLHVLVDLGQLVQASESLFRVGEVRRLHIEALVDEEDVARVHVGDACLVRLNAFPAEVFAGRVSFIAPEAERERHSFEIFVSLDRPPDGLRSGMSAEVNVIAARKEHALLVPREAVVGGRVWRYEADGQIHRRPVKTGIANLQQIEIIDGLNEGDRIAVKPDAPQLHTAKRDAMAIRPVDAPPPAPTTAEGGKGQ